jgi:hypothetical protein
VPRSNLACSTLLRGTIAQGLAMRADGHAISPGRFLEGPEAEQTVKRSDVFWIRWFHTGREGSAFRNDIFPSES